MRALRFGMCPDEVEAALGGVVNSGSQVAWAYRSPDLLRRRRSHRQDGLHHRRGPGADSRRLTAILADAHPDGTGLGLPALLAEEGEQPRRLSRHGGVHTAALAGLPEGRTW